MALQRFAATLLLLLRLTDGFAPSPGAVTRSTLQGGSSTDHSKHHPCRRISAALVLASSASETQAESSTSSSSTNSDKSNEDIGDSNSSQLRSNRPFAPPMPANLRRKLQVRRPQLGHVVPKYARYSTLNKRNKKRGGSDNPRLRPQGKATASADSMNNPSMLKISAGSAKGRRLDSPTVYLRPMMGKVREAVFSTLTSFGLYDASVTVRHLDIFAGSGSVGLESLSRGAVHCTFVDLSQDCCDCIQRNVALCQFDAETQATVHCQDALSVLNEPYKHGISVGQTFQIVTLCPPYEEVVYADLLEGVANCPCVAEDTVVLIEYPIELGCLPHVVARNDGGAMVGVRNRRYGRTVIGMYVVNPTGRLELANSRPEEFVSLR